VRWLSLSLSLILFSPVVCLGRIQRFSSMITHDWFPCLRARRTFHLSLLVLLRRVLTRICRQITIAVLTLVELGSNDVCHTKIGNLLNFCRGFHPKEEESSTQAPGPPKVGEADISLETTRTLCSLDVDPLVQNRLP